MSLPLLPLLLPISFILFHSIFPSTPPFPFMSKRPSPPALFPPQFVFENPPVHHDSIKCDTPICVVTQKPLQQVTCVGVDPIGHGEVHTGYPLVCVTGMFLLERRVANKKLVEEHPEGPYVDTFIMLPSLDHFRRKIVECSAHSRPTGAATGVSNVGRPAKVGEFDPLVKMD